MIAGPASVARIGRGLYRVTGVRLSDRPLTAPDQRIEIELRANRWRLVVDDTTQSYWPTLRKARYEASRIALDIKSL